MAAKKTTGKKAGKTTGKKTGKATGKKTGKAGKKAAKKKTDKKTTAKKKPAAKKKTAKETDSKKAAKKAPATKAAAKPESKPAEKKAPAAARKSGFSSLDVNMGHVFALRPRVPTSFRPDDFRVARQQLEDESFKSASEAAKAVVEKALELTHGDAVPGRKKRQHRF